MLTGVRFHFLSCHAKKQKAQRIYLRRAVYVRARHVVPVFLLPQVTGG
jgi:hypothetical protein